MRGMSDFIWRLRRKARKVVWSTTPLRHLAARRLRRILAQPHKGVVVHLPSVDWGWMVQRPHHLMREFAEAGYLVFFCSPQIMTDRIHGIPQVAERLYLCGDPSLLAGVRQPLVWVAALHSAWGADLFPDGILLYDYVDALDVASGGRPNAEIRSQHAKMLVNADIVVTTAQTLLEEIRSVRPDAMLLPNAVRPADFAPEGIAPPSDLADLLHDGRPVFGYVGALAEWFDYDLLEAVAREMPDACFVLIGPDYDGSLPRDRMAANIRWLGPKPYEVLPAYLRQFSAAMIPFRLNAITRATSPVKLFEYLAADRPVVATPLPECMRYRGLAIASNAAEFVAALRQAALSGQDAAARAERRAVVAANTWADRAAAVMETWTSRFRGDRDLVVIFAGVPLHDSGGGQRPAQLALELANRGRRVLYVHRYDAWERQEARQAIRHPLIVQGHLQAFDATDLRTLWPAGKRCDVIVALPHPDFRPAVEVLMARGATLVYDVIDDWRTSLGGNWYRPEIEAGFVRDATLVTASSGDLQAHVLAEFGRDAILLPNAVNARLFRRPPEPGPRPPDLPSADRVIGYVGALWGDWFDWGLLTEVANAFPTCAVVAIGDYRGQCKDPPPNLRFLGLKAHRDLPGYLAWFDAALIPFKVSRLTQAVSPLKVFEYLAMGVPVAATPLKEIASLPGVFIGETPDGYLSAVEQALACRLTDADIAAILRGHSWEERVNTLLMAVEAARAARVGFAP